jgi:hypothetical protein
MGFPECQWAGGEGGLFGGLQQFVSYVDGKKVEVKHRFPAKSNSHGEGDAYTSWYVKRVDFALGQTRTVENDYFSRYGRSFLEATLEEQMFTYVLMTGATWKGTIGEIAINVDATRLGNIRDIELPKGCIKAAHHQWKWVARDVEPKKDFCINLRPRIPLLNGGKTSDACDPSWSRLEDPHGIAMIGSGFISAVGGEEETDLKKRTCTIRYNGHTLMMKEGTLKAMLDSKAVSLPISIEMPHRYEEGTTQESMVPLVSVVQWFGGSVTTDKKTGRLNVNLKDRNPSTLR